MATFRHILAVPMLLTALGLGWVLSRQSSGGDGLTAGAAGAALLALAPGWWGWRQKHGRRAGVAAAAGVFAVAARKSDVDGTGVSVRADPVGRRAIKKTTQPKTRTP